MLSMFMNEDCLHNVVQTITEHRQEIPVVYDLILGGGVSHPLMNTLARMHPKCVDIKFVNLFDILNQHIWTFMRHAHVFLPC